MPTKTKTTTRLSGASPTEILTWASSEFGAEELVVTASFEDPVLVHLAATAVPGVEIVLIDTGYLFAETLWYAETLQRRLDLNLNVMTPVVTEADRDRWQHDTTGCCGVRKVEPLNRALSGKDGWITGLRRSDSPTRADTPEVSYDLGRHITKINPVVDMTDADMAAYIELHDLPENPLKAKGYPSIGCWPCTQPVQPGEDPRSGRWAGSNKTECGLHV